MPVKKTSQQPTRQELTQSAVNQYVTLIKKKGVNSDSIAYHPITKTCSSEIAYAPAFNHSIEFKFCNLKAVQYNARLSTPQTQCIHLTIEQAPTKWLNLLKCYENNFGMNLVWYLLLEIHPSKKTKSDHPTPYNRISQLEELLASLNKDETLMASDKINTFINVKDLNRFCSFHYTSKPTAAPSTDWREKIKTLKIQFSSTLSLKNTYSGISQHYNQASSKDKLLICLASSLHMQLKSTEVISNCLEIVKPNMLDILYSNTPVKAVLIQPTEEKVELKRLWKCTGTKTDKADNKTVLEELHTIFKKHTETISTEDTMLFPIFHKLNKPFTSTFLFEHILVNKEALKMLDSLEQSDPTNFTEQLYLLTFYLHFNQTQYNNDKNPKTSVSSRANDTSTVAALHIPFYKTLKNREDLLHQIEQLSLNTKTGIIKEHLEFILSIHRGLRFLQGVIPSKITTLQTIRRFEDYYDAATEYKTFMQNWPSNKDQQIHKKLTSHFMSRLEKNSTIQLQEEIKSLQACLPPPYNAHLQEEVYFNHLQLMSTKLKYSVSTQSNEQTQQAPSIPPHLMPIIQTDASPLPKVRIYTSPPNTLEHEVNSEESEEEGCDLPPPAKKVKLSEKEKAEETCSKTERSTASPTNSDISASWDGHLESLINAHSANSFLYDFDSSKSQYPNLLTYLEENESVDAFNDL